MPKVSVVITTHNRPQLLQHAIESAFRAGSDVEVIVVDDASIDETAKVCRNIKCIKYIRVERNQNTAGARNLGILASTSPYISFLDDDDLRIAGSLDWQIALLEGKPEYGLVYGKFFFAGQNGEILDQPPFPEKILEGDVFDQILKENFIGCLTAVFRKECVYKVGLLDPEYTGIDDWDLWVRIAEVYPLMAINRPVAIWRKAEIDSGQGSSNTERLFLLSVKACREKWLKLPRAKEQVEDIKKTDLYKGNRWIESRVNDLEKYINELNKAKEWLENQNNNWKQLAEEREKQIEELKTYIKELIDGKNWLEAQCTNYEKILRMNKYKIDDY